MFHSIVGHWNWHQQQKTDHGGSGGFGLISVSFDTRNHGIGETLLLEMRNDAQDMVYTVCPPFPVSKKFLSSQCSNTVLMLTGIEYRRHSPRYLPSYDVHPLDELPGPAYS